jgi:hypothetical protein
MTTPTTAISHSISMVQTQEELKTAKKELKAWKEHVNERLGKTRVCKNPNNPESLSHFESDRLTVQEYSDVLSFLNQGIEKLPTNTTEDIRIYALKDTSGTTQGMCSITVKTDHIYLNAIASAPWNISMHGESDKVPYKGAGKQLITAIFETAQDKRVEELRTSPLTSALPFYEKLGMQESEARSYWFLPISNAASFFNPIPPTILS